MIVRSVCIERSSVFESLFIVLFSAILLLLLNHGIYRRKILSPRRAEVQTPSSLVLHHINSWLSVEDFLLLLLAPISFLWTLPPSSPIPRSLTHSHSVSPPRHPTNHNDFHLDPSLPENPRRCSHRRGQTRQPDHGPDPVSRCRCRRWCVCRCRRAPV